MFALADKTIEDLANYSFHDNGHYKSGYSIYNAIENGANSSSLPSNLYYQPKDEDTLNGTCLFNVKVALSVSGLVDGYPSVNYAKNFGPVLEQNGWTNIVNNGSINSPNDAPVNSVLIYQQTNANWQDLPSAAGHIELRTPDGFYSDAYQSFGGLTMGGMTRTQQINGRHYKLVGVYVYNGN